MAIVKLIEIMAESEHSWEDATKQALEEASETVRNIQTIDITDLQAIVENDKITHYRINAKLSFIIDR